MPTHHPRRPPAAAAGSSLATLLWSAAASSPEADAIVESGRRTSYAALRARAGAVAAALIRAGLTPGDRVAILEGRGTEAAAALFGAYAAGVVATVINDRLRPRQIEYIVAHAGARALLTTPATLAQLPRPPATAATIVPLDALADRDVEPSPRAAGDPAQIIYTSGSTGLPKGVVFTHAALGAGVQAVEGYLGLTQSDRVASVLSPSTVYGLNLLLCTVCSAATQVVERSAFAADIVEGLREAGVTVLAAVPPLWLQLLAAPAFTERPLATLRQLQNAGSHLPTEAVRRLRRLYPGAALFLQYGQTETFRSSVLDPDEADAFPGSMGRAIPGAEILVVRDDDSACGPDEVGELVFRGPAMAEGYWRDPELTARTFRADPRGGPGRVVYSGDLVRRDGAGRLFFVARRAAILKSMGYRVGPDEIVDVLHASGEVADAAVTGEADAERGDRIVAWVVLAPAGSVESLRRFCRAELPAWMQPARYEVRPVLPRLASGKVDVAALTGPAPE